VPNPGTANNPSGVNSFDHFAPEPPYGEVSNQKRLEQGAPLAVGPITAGALNKPKQAQRNSQRPQQQMVEAAQPGTPPGAPASKSAPTPADIWREIASSPGADQFPILSYYASQ
jgi:hypothetical protein